MIKNIILGLDPGFGGGIAFYGGHQSKLKTVHMPTRKYNRKKKINTQLLVDIIAPHAHKIKIAAIERVGVMSGKETPSSMFNFGYGAGILEGVCIALGIKVVKINPAVWKPALGLNRDKKTSLALARKLFPQNFDDFRFDKDDGKAEAALIAYFAERNL